MENYQLIINAHNRPGSLERILRVIRHRGGIITKMDMQVESAVFFSARFELENSKSKQQISDQLKKLVDIVTVNE